MAQTNRPTPAKAPAAKVKRTNETKPLIDYTALTATDVDASTVRGTRDSMVDQTPFVGWMRESRQNGQGKQLTVPDAAVKQTVKLIRDAARRVNCGVRIVPGQSVKGETSIAFKAKDKRKSTPKSK